MEIGAKHLGLNNIANTRIDKYIQFDVDANDKKSAKKEVAEYCHKLLANPIMEDYEFTLEEVKWFHLNLALLFFPVPIATTMRIGF